MKDKIVELVVDKFQQRSKVGIEKYKTTLEMNNVDNYILHAQQESMDLSLYLEKIMYFNAEITKLVKDNPHDADLGFEIRKLYTNK